MQPGDWAVFVGQFGFEAAQVERVTDSRVYGKAVYKTQHEKSKVKWMPDEATARRAVEQAKSARAEANRRQREAEIWYQRQLGTIFNQPTT